MSCLPFMMMLNTLVYLITVQHLLNVHMAFKEGQFDVVELMVNDQFKNFSINLNAQYLNGMTLE